MYSYVASSVRKVTREVSDKGSLRAVFCHSKLFSDIPGGPSKTTTSILSVVVLCRLLIMNGDSSPAYPGSLINTLSVPLIAKETNLLLVHRKESLKSKHW